MTTGASHKHGGNPRFDLERFGIPPRPVMDFSVNISPLGPPKKVRDAWPQMMEDMSRYPSTDGGAVVRYYGSRFGLPPECVLPGNGSIEMIYLVPRTLRLNHAALISPSFHDYERSLELTGVSITRITLSPDDGFAPPTLERLRRALLQADAIFLGNPNNPTATSFRAADLLDLADEFPDKLILVDEAFVQFLDDFEETTLLCEYRIRRNILVFHSLTKFYAIPGLRIGCVAGHPDTISMLRHHRIPWSVNSVAERVASLLAECGEYESAARKLNSQERERISDRLSDIDSVRLFDASANFFLAEWRATADLDDLLRELLSDGLYVRDCRNFPGLEDGYFRFCVRLPDENDRLISAIEGYGRG
ncbi:MAG: threonine-phosphate decarboxylase [Deltaproteobacteria bacterium]|nr:threonine-phosphate decarboxylase [Deltaproteobacteria bacterium]